MTGPVERLTVIGAGLVGASIARAAVAAGVGRVRVTDADAEVRAQARALGIGHEVLDDVAGACEGADVVIAAVPAAAVAEVLVAAAAAAPAQVILTDAASLKADLTLEVESRLRVEVGSKQLELGSRPEPEAPELETPEQETPEQGTGSAVGSAPQVGPRSEAGVRAAGRFVGGHPMAGSERSGPDAADEQLFQGATWVLTPTATTDDDVLPRLSTLLRAFGARVVALEPDRHDELVAIVSHLPQVVASVLADVAADAVEATGDAVLSVAGGGYRDTTRIAASDPALWLPILEGNRAAVLEALEAYADRLDVLREALQSGDATGVESILARASRGRRQLAAKAEAREVVDLIVPLDDRPGQLAAATTALGQAGVNVEDLAMRHATEGSRGALLVRVAAADRARAIEALSAQDLHAHVDTTDTDVDAANPDVTEGRP